MSRIIYLGLLAAWVIVLPAKSGMARPVANSPTTSDLQGIVENMERRIQQQSLQVKSFQATREYSATSSYLREPAYWKLSESYVAPGERTLRTLERRGPRFLDQVLLKPMIEAEVETAKSAVRPLVDITRANYTFHYIRNDPARKAHVFRIEPRRKGKYLVRGAVWIDQADFGISRIEGEPAQEPSSWVRETHFVHEFARFDDQWFPVRHRSEALLRLFGKATLEIQYSQYSWQKN